MKKALEETKKIAGAYKGSTREYVREDENGEIVVMSEFDADSDGERDMDDESVMNRNYDVAELITDNQILLDRVDALLDGDETDGPLSTRRSMDRSEDVDSLTSSLIDGLYNQIKKGESREKKQVNKQKKPTNFHDSKK